LASELSVSGKQGIAVVLLVSIVVVNATTQVKNISSPEPFFTLISVGFTPTQMDILNLIRQYLFEININLDILQKDIPDGGITKIRNFDLMLVEFSNDSIVDHQFNITNDPFFSEFYSENGTINLSGYDTSLDWDEELETGRNEWYIQTGLQLTPNDSQERIRHCWEWQHYMMNEILPCFPLFSHKDNSSFQLLFFNLRETRNILGSQELCPEYPYKPQGLAIRKAISYGINREEIRRVVFGDEYEIFHHPIISSSDEWLNPDIFKFCYNYQVASNYAFLPGYALGIHNYGGYHRWPDWEFVCFGTPTPTISVDGFSLKIASSCIVLCSILFLYFRIKRRKKI